MPITKSAKKALRQSAKRRMRNLAQKDAYLMEVKEIKKLASAGKLEEAKSALPRLYQVLDKAVKTNVITKNKASRLKSRITRSLSGKN